MCSPWTKSRFSRKFNRKDGSGPELVREFGLETLYDSGTAKVECAITLAIEKRARANSISHSIVAVHGLNGHRELSFTTANGICWLRTLLPEQNPDIRVLSYGYDVRTQSTSPLSQENLHDHAEQLIEELSRERQTTKVNT